MNTSELLVLTPIESPLQGIWGICMDIYETIGTVERRSTTFLAMQCGTCNTRLLLHSVVLVALHLLPLQLSKGLFRFLTLLWLRMATIGMNNFFFTPASSRTFS